MFTFRILAWTVLSLVLITDAILVEKWDTIRESLGGIFGLELGLALFFNFLGALLVVELLHEWGARPGFLEWYRKLPAGSFRYHSKSSQRRATIRGRVSTLAAMTLFFYGVDMFLLPVVPAPLKLPVDLAAIAIVVAVCALDWRSLSRVPASEPRGYGS